MVYLCHHRRRSALVLRPDRLEAVPRHLSSSTRVVRYRRIRSWRPWTSIVRLFTLETIPLRPRETALVVAPLGTKVYCYITLYRSSRCRRTICATAVMDTIRIPSSLALPFVCLLNLHRLIPAAPARRFRSSHIHLLLVLGSLLAQANQTLPPLSALLGNTHRTNLPVGADHPSKKQLAGTDEGLRPPSTVVSGGSEVGGRRDMAVIILPLCPRRNLRHPTSVRGHLGLHRIICTALNDHRDSHIPRERIGSRSHSLGPRRRLSRRCHQRTCALRHHSTITSRWG
jgi:hypothetical protein